MKYGKIVVYVFRRGTPKICWSLINGL